MGFDCRPSFPAPEFTSVFLLIFSSADLRIFFVSLSLFLFHSNFDRLLRCQAMNMNLLSGIYYMLKDLPKEMAWHSLNSL